MKGPCNRWFWWISSALQETQLFVCIYVYVWVWVSESVRVYERMHAHSLGLEGMRG